MRSLPQRVEIVEVGPRDGLQNEAKILPVDVRVELIEALARAGLKRIEVGSFVSSKAAPQMVATGDVLRALGPRPELRLSVLTPNLRGLVEARAARAAEIAVFAAASETFSQRNINCTIAQSLDRYAEVVAEAAREGVCARGYVSCALGCPYEGAVDLRQVVAVARALRQMGCVEISLGDTIGVGAPLAARALVESVAKEVGMERVAVHFHDTYGQALANVFACLEVGVGVVDASVAGLGGCPFAPGASGNLATENLVYMLDGLGVESGVDLRALTAAGSVVSQRLGRSPSSAVARALAARAERGA